MPRQLQESKNPGVMPALDLSQVPRRSAVLSQTALGDNLCVNLMFAELTEVLIVNAESEVVIMYCTVGPVMQRDAL